MQQKVRTYIGKNHLALLALLVSAITAYAMYRQQAQSNQAETGYFRFVEAKIIRDLPAIQLPADKFISDISFSPPITLLNPAAVIAVWVEIKVTNTGFRTFSIDSVDSGIAANTEKSFSVLSDFGYPDLNKNFESPSRTKPVTFPKAVASGEQVKFYRQMIFGLAPKEAARLKQSKSLLERPAPLVVNSLIEYELAASPLVSGSRMALSDSYMVVSVTFAEPLTRLAEPNFSTVDVSLY